jgi:2-C-methyl-D-erythritol 4-phosphate cytidylyltransferase
VVLRAVDEAAALWMPADASLATLAAWAIQDAADPVLVLVAGTPAIGRAVTAALPGRTVLVEADPLAALRRVGTIADTAVDVVLMHELTRALTPLSLIGDVIAAVRGGARVAVPMLPESDTVKNVAANGHVLSTVDRDMLRTVQSPYGFARQSLDLLPDRPYEIEALGWLLGAGRVEAVPGHPDAFDIDGPATRRLAEQLLHDRLAPA